MGKHNGKARSGSGPKVGSALLNSQNNSKKQEWAAYRHTTSLTKDTGMQSVIEQNDLSELMSMAELAGRDFAGVRGEAVIIAPGGPTAKDMEVSAAQRQTAQERNAHKLAIPRRPHWTRDMTTEQIQQQEQSMFLNWRRNLAWLEDEENLVLTPFEKNLEVWRQLWRVVERSDILVQVVDARDPLCYRSEDLEDYVKTVHADAECLLLLNKADLLPEALRIKWADYFDTKGVKYVFWSAYQAIQRQKVEKTAAALALGTKASREDAPADPRVTVLDEEGLLEVFAKLARETLEAAGPSDDRNDPNNKHTPTIGLVGYPNVGKSSTINALFGSKKTAVAPTPGKTKHFQTLYISPDMLLCDCPGLVFPKFATSKGSMVAAGVIPIDRLTEMHAPTAVLAHRISRQQLFARFSIAMPRPKLHEDPHRDPTAVELLAAYARSRAWFNGSGLPDETRAGRQLLKDYTSGRLVYCEWPPETERPCPYDDGLRTFTRDESLLSFAEDTLPSTSGQQNMNKVSAEDARDMKAMDIPVVAGNDKPTRPAYKFHKKPPKDTSRNMRKVKAGDCPYGSFDVA